MIGLFIFFVGLVIGYQFCKLSNKGPINSEAKVNIKIGPISNKEK